MGREQEVGLLVDRWEQAKEGRGQVVLLSGEPGIGKSRLAYTLREHVTREGSLLFEARCSPYHQHSAFYPLIDVLQRTLLFTPQDTDEEKSAKLERALALYNLQETLPLFTALLSLPTPSQYPPLTLTPQKQKERTLQALRATVRGPSRAPSDGLGVGRLALGGSVIVGVSLVAHRADSHDQAVARADLPARVHPAVEAPLPPFSAGAQSARPEAGRSDDRESEQQAKRLSAEVIEQIRSQDGWGAVVCGGVDQERGRDHAESLGQCIPTTAWRFPRPCTKRYWPGSIGCPAPARWRNSGRRWGGSSRTNCCTRSRPLERSRLTGRLAKLVEAEILYQRGIGEQARYFFKHALIQDTAYQSLLKSTRQQYHQQIAQVLEERIRGHKRQPTGTAGASLHRGRLDRASDSVLAAGGAAGCPRSANGEASNHLTKGIELLKTLPHTSERIQQELVFQTILGSVLMAIKGYAAPEAGQAYARARELCQQIGATPQLWSSTVWTVGLLCYTGGTQDSVRTWGATAEPGPEPARHNLPFRSSLDAGGLVVPSWRADRCPRAL